MNLADFGNVHRAVVLSVDANGVTVEIPMLAPNAPWGPIPTCVPNLAVGEAVLVTQISTSRDTLAVVGRVPGRAPTISEIATLAATIAALQATDTAIQSAATALAARVTTAEGTIVSNTSAIAGHTTRLNTDEANITTNTTGIATNTSAIAANTSAITAVGARVTTLEDLTRVGASRLVMQRAGDQVQNNANGGTTYTNSPELTLPVISGASYYLEGQFIYDTDPAVQIKFKINPPALSGFRCAPWFSGGTSGDSPIWHDVFDGFEFVPGGKTGTGMMSCRPAGWLIIGGTSGAVTVQMAQSVAGAAFAVLKNGSTLRLTRVA